MALVTLKTNTMATVGREGMNYRSGPNMPEDLPIMPYNSHGCFCQMLKLHEGFFALVHKGFGAFTDDL